MCLPIMNHYNNGSTTSCGNSLNADATLIVTTAIFVRVSDRWNTAIGANLPRIAAIWPKFALIWRIR